MEQRTEARIPNHIKFFVHIHECVEDPDMVGESVSCEAEDLSIHGLQFCTEQKLHVGSMLNITIGIGDPFAMYLLRGEIRWVKEEKGEYYMGILLKDEKHMDLAKWIENFDKTGSP